MRRVVEEVVGRAGAAGSARLLGSKGAKVAVSYFTSKAKAVVADIAGADDRAAAYRADVRQRGEVEAVVSRAEAELGPIDTLVAEP